MNSTKRLSSQQSSEDLEVSVGDPPARYAPRHRAHPDTNRPLRMHSHREGRSSCGEAVKHTVTSSRPRSKHLHISSYTKSKLSIVLVEVNSYVRQTLIVLHSWD